MGHHVSAHVEDAMKNANEAIAALKRQKPTSADAARARSVELMRLNQLLLDAARKVTDANAAKRLANGSNGAQPVEVVATDLSEGVIKALATGLIPFLRETIAPLKERLDALETTQLTDGGTWKPDKVFRPNQLTSYRGANLDLLGAEFEHPARFRRRRLAPHAQNGRRWPR